MTTEEKTKRVAGKQQEINEFAVLDPIAEAARAGLLDLLDLLDIFQQTMIAPDRVREAKRKTARTS